MEVINSTRMPAGHTIAMDKSGREHIVVAVKGTFRIPPAPETTLALHEEQLPLLTSDVYFGEPGLSAPKYEADFVLRKHRCDVLLNGTAYAPSGKPTKRVVVGMHIGSWSKSFAVVGDRFWYKSHIATATSPRPFVSMPITYDRAFGGSDLRHANPMQHGAFMPNPTGRGYHKHLAAEWLEGSPLPNTEELNDPVIQPDGLYRPMAFGPIGRHWEPRYRYAGTYDEKWLEDVFPFLPDDFDEQYYQSAPSDQQLPRLQGEQRVTLVNLTPEGQRHFILPHFEAPIYVFPKAGPREDLLGRLDSIMIEPDLDRVTMTWRAERALKKNVFEIAQILIGRKGREWWQKRERVAFPIPIVVEPPSEHDSAKEEVLEQEDA